MLELAMCEKQLLEEIAHPKSKRIDIAKTYALTLKSSERDTVDWAKVNGAIRARWSMAALKWIKDMAWSGRAFNDGKNPFASVRKPGDATNKDQ